MPDVGKPRARPRRDGTPQPLASAEEVSEYLGIPVKTLYNWRSLRPPYGPQATRVGRWLRYDWDEVKAWYADRSKVGAA